PQQKSGNGMRIFLSLVLILGCLALGYYFIQNNTQQNQISQIQSTTGGGYTIGMQIDTVGTLKQDDSDLITYTHVFTSSDGKTYFLKSKTLPLNNYTSVSSGEFQVLGTLEAIYKNTPLVEVTGIVPIASQNQQASTGQQEVQEEVKNPGIYVANAGLYFGQEFFDSFVFVGQAGENGKIEVKNLENDKVTKIEFFTCTNGGDTNCKELTRTFKDTSAQVSTTSNGDTFYKLGEVKTWYFQNGDTIGYFINNADDEEVLKIKNLITIVSPEYVKQLVNLYGVKVCLGIDNGLNRITSHTIKTSKSGIEASIQGAGEKNFTCQVSVDPTLPNKLKFIDLKVSDTNSNPQSATGTTQQTTQTGTDTKKTEEKKTETTTTPSGAKKEQATTRETSYNPNVKQFPISEDRQLTYSSARGAYEVTFPSMNISYEGFNTDVDFGQAGVRCSYGLRVIKHSDKDLLSTNPTVVVYECKSKGELTSPGENYIIKELGDKKFVIEVRDGAWLEFAKNIVIQTIS
ncbi:MAG: hypothetical protein HG424_001660, partial [candidate division SR1 bacterium]|nr:hypothetical protein [candidate division SR1 bacterium]